MPRIPPTKWHQVKHWRLQATAADGIVVTLGRYITAQEAHADREFFERQGRYGNIIVQPIELSPDAVQDEFRRRH